ncbi:MAG TPA: hypothetical protein VGN34_14790 [Ktedonobacteraceae bacterium]
MFLVGCHWAASSGRRAASELVTETFSPRQKGQPFPFVRLPAKRDQQINLDNWQHVVQFCLACGLRREELRDLYVGEVNSDPNDPVRLVISV